MHSPFDLAKQEETPVEPVVINMFDESARKSMKKIISVLRAQKKVAVDESMVNWAFARPVTKRPPIDAGLAAFDTSRS